MLDFHHPNVLSLVGVIFDTTDHLPVIVLPFMAHGDLRSFLKSKRTRTSSTSSSTDTLPTVSKGHVIHVSACSVTFKYTFYFNFLGID